MKTPILKAPELFLILLTLVMALGFAVSAGSTAWAAKTPAANGTSAAKSAGKSKSGKAEAGLSRDIHFEDASVRGKYQYADEAIAEVENEKGLDDLLGPRKHFKDRAKQATTRY